VNRRWCSRRIKTRPGQRGAVVKVPLNGGTPITLAALGGYPMGLAVDATNVYLTTTTGCVFSSTGHLGYELMSIPVDGGTPTRLISELSSDASAHGVAIDNANIYWSYVELPAGIYHLSRTEPMLGGKILKLPLGGGTPTVLASGFSQPLSVVVDGTNVYFTDNIGYTVMSVPIAGGLPTTLAKSTDGNEPFVIAVDANHVYWTHGGQGAEIRRVPLGGGTPTIVASGLNYPNALVIDTTSIYWTESCSVCPGSGSVMKLRVH